MKRDRWKQSVALGAAFATALTLFTTVGVAQGPPSTGSKRMPRAYQGAPPLVPHDVEARKGLCRECHATGEQGAPITPHPTRTHFCIQCHIGQDLSVKPFVEQRTK